MIPSDPTLLSGGIVLEQHSDKSFEDRVKEVARAASDILATSLRSLLAILQSVWTQIALLDRLVITQAKGTAMVRHLMSVPGRVHALGRFSSSARPLESLCGLERPVSLSTGEDSQLPK